MSVGDETIDAQHQKLLKEIDVLLSAFITNSSDMKISEAINFLSAYITEHLAYEESYMEKHHYPEIEFHKSLHRNFIDHYELFKKEITNEIPKQELISEIAEYIGKWWLQHILIEDKKYALFIQQKEK